MIQVKDLSFNYGSKKALKNINMELKGGNIYGLLGENGVGKTTILTLLCGLKKPLTGTIDTDGRNPFDRQPSLLAEQFYLPDEVSPVRYKAIDFGRENGALWPLFDFIKKTWIAFALACNARHYFMDEPTNGLDIPSKSQFRKAIMKYTCEDSAIVISTHQVRDLEEIIDPIIILDKEDVLLNASLETITRKLFFDYGNQIHADALYLEHTPSGAIQVYPNNTGEESKVNLEALFNAVHSHKDIIKALFA